MSALRRRGADFVTGVPCSFLTPVINAAITEPTMSYVGATSEGEAIGLATGYWLAGGMPVVMAQNSGLGNMVNPLTSLARPARVPILLLCTWRGQPGLRDEPQHEQMGRVMTRLLDTIEIEWELLEGTPELLDRCLDHAYASLARRDLPYCLVVRRGTVADGPLVEPEIVRPPRGVLRVPGPRCAGEYAGTRIQVLERLLTAAPSQAAIIATTGKTGRELYTLADRPQHFYLVGSMGCASAVGLGIALGLPRPVVVLDGDGAALMKLGNFASIGAQAPPNLIHVLLDNRSHDSTGGQRTYSGGISFPEIAIACGYASAATCTTPDDVDHAFGQALRLPGPHLVHVLIRPGSLPHLGRPTISPHEVARRFRAHFGAHSRAA